MANTTYLVVFVAYMILVLLVGLYAWRFTETEPVDFYLADRKTGKVFLALTLMATIASAFAFFGLGATASGAGIGIITFIAFFVVLQPVGFLVFGTTINDLGRELGHVSPIEYLNDRYDGYGVGAVYLVVSALFGSAFVAAQIIGGGIALDLLVGIPYNVGILVMAAIMAIYIHLAGFRGVVWSDALQGTVMFLGMILLVIVAYVTIGPAQLASGVMENKEALFTIEGPVGIWNPVFVGGFVLFSVLNIPAKPEVYQRFLAAQDYRHIRDASIIFPIIVVPIVTGGVILGVWSVGIIPSPANPDYVIPLMFDQVAPTILAAIALSAGIAALMSSSDSVVLATSLMVGRDLFKTHLEPEASDAREVHVTQIVMFVMIVLAFLLAFTQPASIFGLVILQSAAFATLVPAVFGGRYWKGGTSAGAIASIVVAIAYIVLNFVDIAPTVLGLHYGFIGLVISVVVYYAVSKVTSGPPEEVLDTYFEA